MEIQTLFNIDTITGLSVRHLEWQVREPIERHHEGAEPAIGYSYCLEGEMRCSVPEARFVNHVQSGRAGLWRLAEEPIYIHASKGVHKWIEVSFPGASAEKLLQENELRLTARARELFLKQNGPLSLPHPCPAHAAQLVGQMLACPFDGLMREYYLASKGMELILGEFAFLCLGRTDGTVCTCSKQVKEAARLLEEHLENPLSVPEVARVVGLSESSLKRSFKKVYGVSVFAFFQKIRMEHAKNLLAKKEMNVTEVAYTLGYSAPEHFSRAFRVHFGFPPKGLR